MADAQLLKRIQCLPPHQQRQVFDLVEFLGRETVVERHSGLPAIDDLIGKLALKGDPVAIQRKMRRE